MFALHQSDRWFVQRLHGEAAVGVYGIGYKLGTVGNTVLLEAFGLIWFPFVFALAHADEARLVLRKVATYATLGFAFVTLFLALFAREVSDLLAAPEFAAAAEVLPLVAFGYLFWAVFQLVHTTFYLRHRTGHVAWLVGGAAVLNLTLNALLVPAHGGLGAAWATVGTFAALAIAAWIAAEHLWPVGFEFGRIAVVVGLAAARARGGVAARHLESCRRGGGEAGSAPRAARSTPLLRLPRSGRKREDQERPGGPRSATLALTAPGSRRSPHGMVESIHDLRKKVQEPVRANNDVAGVLVGDRVSIHVTRLFLSWGLSPDVATIGMLVCGVVGSVLALFAAAGRCSASRSCSSTTCWTASTARSRASARPRSSRGASTTSSSTCTSSRPSSRASASTRRARRESGGPSGSGWRRC
jgi:hypothetical protein